MSVENRITGILAGTFLLIGFNLGTLVGKYTGRVIPGDEQVQQGYIAPSKLEIKCVDLDGYGKPETIMKIDKKSYLLKEVDGKPVLLEYNIKPAEVIPKY